jgi:8-oxo-dGTP pyrophosphatase MutT (NUDIX family)
MNVIELRERLKRAPLADAVYGDDGTEGREAAATVAAVLVPIISHPKGLTVLFTQRTTHLRSHSGQVSFPGGRAEPGDASAEFTALRETEEEIGLRPASVEVLARLPDYRTRTGYRVTPVIGLLTLPVAFTPDPHEVAEIFEVPLDFLLDERNRQRRTREFQGQQVGYYVFEYGQKVIWGATAGMLVNLHKMLA